MRVLRLLAGRRDLGVVRAAGLLVGIGALCLTEGAHAAAEPKERTISTDEVVSWLDSNGEQAPPLTDSGAEEEPLAPPPPPRHKGFVVESGIGAFGQIGEMKHISPIAPWFHLQFGYEPFRFLLVFAEGDLMVSNTSYAHQPPPTRTYSLWGFGGGLRATVKVHDRLGLYLQASAGGAEVTADILNSYGYRSADGLNLYLAGELGVEWYQVSPHFALTVHGGLRDYTRTFKRDESSQPPLAWVSALGLRYTF
jgi:hypothetical protein